MREWPVGRATLWPVIGVAAALEDSGAVLETSPCLLLRAPVALMLVTCRSVVHVPSSTDQPASLASTPRPLRQLRHL